MNDTQFIAMMGWDVRCMRSGKVTRVAISDGKTEVPFGEALKADILKALGPKIEDRIDPFPERPGSDA